MVHDHDQETTQTHDNDDKSGVYHRKGNLQNHKLESRKKLSHKQEQESFSSSSDY